MSTRGTAVGTDHPWPAWFADTAAHAGLLTNRTLRTYLLAHPAEQWPRVVKVRWSWQRLHPADAQLAPATC